MARPETYKTPLGRRLADVRKALGHDGRSGFAALLGIKPDTLGSYERGVAKPDMELLVAYRRLFGVNLSWLIAEDGPMFDDPSKAPAPATPVVPELLLRLQRAARRAYKAHRQEPPEDVLVVEAGGLYNALLLRVTDLRDEAVVDAVIPVLVRELEERLAQAAAEPGTGKRAG